MREELNDQIKELVNPEVYGIVDKSTDHYSRLGAIQKTMNRIEEAGEKKLDSNNWRLIIESRTETVLYVNQGDVLSPLMLETVKQLINLLEAIHYSERKATIIEFNNSLKECNDGKNTSK